MLLSTFLYTFQTFHGKSLKSFQQIEKNTSFLLSLQIKFRSFYGSKIYKYSLIFNITWMALSVSYPCQKLRHSNNFSKILAILTKKLPLPAKERKKILETKKVFIWASLWRVNTRNSHILGVSRISNMFTKNIEFWRGTGKGGEFTPELDYANVDKG